MSDEKKLYFLGDQENNNATIDDKVDDDINNDHVDYNNDDDSLNLAKQVWISFHCSCFEELKQLVSDNESRITVHLHEVGDRLAVAEALLAANRCTEHVVEFETKLEAFQRG